MHHAEGEFRLLATAFDPAASADRQSSDRASNVLVAKRSTCYYGYQPQEQSWSKAVNVLRRLGVASTALSCLLIAQLAMNGSARSQDFSQMFSEKELDLLRRIAKEHYSRWSPKERKTKCKIAAEATIISETLHHCREAFQNQSKRISRTGYIFLAGQRAVLDQFSQEEAEECRDSIDPILEKAVAGLESDDPSVSAKACLAVEFYMRERGKQMGGVYIEKVR